MWLKFVSVGFLLVLLVSCSSTIIPRNASDSLGLRAICFAINDTEIRVTSADEFESEILTLPDLNLEGHSSFWKDHTNYFMHALGSLSFPEGGEYHFRLSVAGKMTLKIDNQVLFQIAKPMPEAEYEATMVVNDGKNLVEIEYYDGDIEPKLKLMWSRDGEIFSVIPAENYSRADLTGGGHLSEGQAKETFSIQPDNTLNQEEIDQGWQLLFDGKTTQGWHTYNDTQGIGKKWRVEDGTIMFEGRDRFRYLFEGRQMEMGPADPEADGGLSIVTDEAFENFELKLAWKISFGGNNGIFFTVLEEDRFGDIWHTSPEMQILHDEIHRDGLIETHRSGDLFDLIACSEVTVKPQGEWNLVKIVKNRGQVEHWQNGIKVVEYDLNSQKWQDMISNSKFANLSDYGTTKMGKIGFQDHHNPVWFKNIKIRKLD